MYFLIFYRLQMIGNPTAIEADPLTAFETLVSKIMVVQRNYLL